MTTSALSFERKSGRGFHWTETTRWGVVSAGSTTSTGGGGPACAARGCAINMAKPTHASRFDAQRDRFIATAREQASRQNVQHPGRLCAIGARMSRRCSILAVAVLAVVASFVTACPARAADGGTESDAQAEAAGDDSAAADAMAAGDDAAVDQGGGASNDGPSGDGYTVACDGALCATLGPGPGVPGTCAVARRAAGGHSADLTLLALIGSALAMLVVRRWRDGARCPCPAERHRPPRPSARAARRFGIPRSLVMLVSVAAVAATMPVDAVAQVVPPPTELPQTISLDEALRVFRARGLDLLIAEAAVRNAEGATKVAGAVPNPVVGGSWGYAFTYQKNDPSCANNGTQCDNQVWNANVSDSAALEDSLAGKRDLRLKVARNALAAAKMSRVDAERTIAFQVKSAYVQVAQGVLGYRFAKQVADSNAKMLELFETRFKSGAINEGDLARIQTQKLESDQALDTSLQTVRQARVALAFLLGVRGAVPDFDVDTKVLDFAVPPALGAATEESLLRTAFDHRPDLIALGYQRASSAAQVDLTKRQRFPDITLSLAYAQGGYGGLGTNGPLQTPTVTVGASAPVPVFYQLQGEVGQARALDDTNALQQAKTSAQVISDVSTAYAAYTGGRRLVERMESGGLLQSARVARDITRLQYDKGAASLTDYLTALQAYIATNVEYIGDLGSFWTAVFQLEQAVGADLH
jgi:cobalt-zinc-cadmium efflux system outer membrane protein